LNQSLVVNQQLAFVFPGQGSQKIGMLAELADRHPELLDTFSEASTQLGYDLWHLCQQGDSVAINLTERTQPLLLTASVALWRLWRQQGGVLPAVMAGHSLGEWSALVCADVVAFNDAVELVRKRGTYMQAAVPAGMGAMAAVMGLDDAEIERCCVQAAAAEVVAPVNYNAPGQVVIAGHAAAVARAIELCKAAGAKRALPLPVSAPFHTELMRPAAERLAADIAATRFDVPAIPVIHNVHARAETDPAVIKELMVRQIYSPVRWVDCVAALTARGVALTVECGAGKVLCGLNKRIAATLATAATEDDASLAAALAAAGRS
jgi:[acyl-carrier-protein] S-malonyltransferase